MNQTELTESDGEFVEPLAGWELAYRINKGINQDGK